MLGTLHTDSHIQPATDSFIAPRTESPESPRIQTVYTSPNMRCKDMVAQRDRQKSR